ncbi:LPS export ABC transporter periplasmic protein LptC [Leeia sp. TBRC 13508]|uniref:LPS export ABC transporter periplasmic protein LptC n=1 Tax=Leeia speluncae TaxID=2884804 RepID=A0ABS8D667_9NEIS|nr:LPS export ABC transporter periplasmic protein LptC [Leeia speluncae]MCB6183690.1 LPS export ABC transporter periplasmic protein LptC [Leeia speluncae]
MRFTLFKHVPWFPLAVLLLLAGLSFWLRQIVQPTKLKLDGSDRHDPDYVIEKFVATRMGANGVPTHLLTADKLVHYPDTDTSELFSSHLIQYQPGLPDEHIVSKVAIRDKTGNKLYFDKGVTMSRAGYAKKPALHIYTTNMTVWPEEKRMETDAVVVLTEGTTKITAQGLTYNQLTKQVVFKHKVRVVLLNRKS